MALVTDQQETMFTEPEEAVASLQEELIHNEAAEAEDEASAEFGSLDFPTEPVLAPAEPVAASIAAVELDSASTEEEDPAPEASAETAPVAAVVEPAVEATAALEEAALPAVSDEAAPVEPAAETVPEVAPDETAHAETTPAETVADEPLPMLTAADFSALEERVLRAVGLVRREREARIAAEERVLVLEGRIAALEVESNQGGRLKEEIESLRAEREQVRLRVERLLGQLDALEF